MKYFLVGFFALGSISSFASTCYMKETQEIFRPQDHYWSTGSYEHRAPTESIDDCLKIVDQMRSKLGRSQLNSEKVCINEEIGIYVQCEDMQVQRTVTKIKYIYFTNGKKVSHGVFKL